MDLRAAQAQATEAVAAGGPTDPIQRAVIRVGVDLIQRAVIRVDLGQWVVTRVAPSPETARAPGVTMSAPVPGMMVLTKRLRPAAVLV